MKIRKPSLDAQKKHADELLKNELVTRRACLETANKKIDELIEKIKSGDTSKKIQKELAEQYEIAIGIKAWIDSHEKTA